jgi:beta-galactosidase
MFSNSGSKRAHQFARPILHVLLFVLALSLARGRAMAQPSDPSWGKEPEETVSPVRADLCLNGQWLFEPVRAAETAQPRDSEWGLIHVPGAWNLADKRIPMPDIAAVGAGDAWKGLGTDPVNKAWAAVDRAWYERPITIPAGWAGRGISLELARVSTDANVWLDGVSCGHVAWPGGEIDLSAAAKPGTTQRLRLLVTASLTEKIAQVYMGPGAVQASTRAAKLNSRGITGDVVLHSRPRDGFVTDVFCRPSVRQKRLDLDVDLTGAMTGDISFTADACRLDGTIEHTFAATAPAAASVTLSFPWPDPRLWDVGHGELYRLRLTAKGAGIDDVFVQEFGFREFWIDGKKLMLNGTEFRMRPCGIDGLSGISPVIDGWISGITGIGFNIAELWPWDRNDRGTLCWDDLWYEHADRAGLPLMGALPSMAGIAKQWEDPATRTTWQTAVATDLRRIRNHPSVFVWVHSPNRFGIHDDEDPRLLGRPELLAVSTEPGMDKVIAAGQAACSFIHAQDPTRPVTTHAGGAAGDISMSNMYLNFTEMQEQEEWLSDWVRTGEVPTLPGEFGFYPCCDFKRGRNYAGWNPTGTGATHSEPLITEWTASLRGSVAYRDETWQQRRVAPTYFQRGEEYKYSGGFWVRDPQPEQVEFEENLRTTRAWRTIGATCAFVPFDYPDWWNHDFETGGRKPADDPVALPSFVPGARGVWVPNVPRWQVAWLTPKAGREAPAVQALRRGFSPILAWIVGPAEGDDPAAFTSKDHSFAPGQAVAKRIALVNGTRDIAHAACHWQATLDGKEFATGDAKLDVPPGNDDFGPITFTCPAAAAPVDGQITLTCTVDTQTYTDAFPFRVIPPRVLENVAVEVLDPTGITTAWLRAAGATVTTWDGKPTPNLLVIGRNAMTGNSPADVKAFVDAGGRCLMTAQSPDWFRANPALRVSHTVIRRVFAVDPKHPVLDGLIEADLRDWAGSSTLVDAYPPTDPAGPMGTPPYGWHWGNRMAVTSAAIEKPHRAGWRPILECDFDLAFSPLMEIDLGAGRLWLCTLDLEDHVPRDAAATRLAQNLLAYAAASKPEPRSTHTVYLGGDVGWKQVQEVGVKCTRANALPVDADLVICDSASAGDASGSRGKVVVLSGNDATGPLGLTRVLDKAAFGTCDVPQWPEARGLSASDLRWRTTLPAWRFTDGPGWEIGAGGYLARHANMIAVQIDPDRFNADVKTYFRYTRWRQTRALAQVLANAGAAFTADGDLLRTTPDDSSIPLAGPWEAKPITLVPGDSEAKPVDNGPSQGALAAIAESADSPGWQRTVGGTFWQGFVTSVGEAVFRRTVTIPPTWAGHELELRLGNISDYDVTYVDGHEVGRTGQETKQWWAVPRRYHVPAADVHAGPMTIGVRIFDVGGSGGLKGPPDSMRLAPADAAPTGSYYPDYRDDFPLGDDPARYCRW